MFNLFRRSLFLVSLIWTLLEGVLHASPKPEIDGDVTPTSQSSSTEAAGSVVTKACHLDQLPHTLKMEIIEWLGPQSQGRLMNASKEMRRLALQLKGRQNDESPWVDLPDLIIPNQVRQSLLTTIIARQTGDFAHFMNRHAEGFQTLPFSVLRDLVTSGHYYGALSTKTEHGRRYQALNLEYHDYNYDTDLDFSGQRLFLVPLNFQGRGLLQKLDLSRNLLVVLPNLSSLVNLRILKVEDNQLLIPPNVEKLTKLHTVSLDTKLSEIPPIISSYALLYLCTLTNETLIKHHNLKRLINIRTVYLSGNMITEISIIQLPKSLRVLNLSFNSLSHLQLVWTPLTNLPHFFKSLLTDGRSFAIPGRDESLLKKVKDYGRSFPV